jgi:hypothetical protein
MICRVPVFSLVGMWIALYFLVRPLFLESRDGSLERVGKGRQQSWAELRCPPSMHTSKTILSSSGGVLHMLEYVGERPPRLSFLLIHDLAEHAGALRDFGSTLAEKCGSIGSACNVYAVRCLSCVLHLSHSSSFLISFHR